MISSHSHTRFALCALLFAGCGGSDPGNASFQVRESVNQLAITHAKPGTELGLHDASNALVMKGTTDDLGSFIFRDVPAGDGYVVRATQLTPPQYSRRLHVMSVTDSQPDPSFYRSQKIVAGSGYVTTRDGTTLSIYVTLPGPIDKGPYPTVIDYSGYSPSKPGQPIPKYSFLCDSLPTLCDAPNDPSAELAGLFGYATVSVNLRGTGCSGGAYDYFEPLQLLDGYDVIETIAAQDWVYAHHVAMTGISYPGISQLFVGKTNPPSLVAITPVSVIGNTATTLVPGGMLNDGFAIEWVSSVLDKAAPYGQGWEMDRVKAGDTICQENQLLHDQRVDNVAQARDPRNYVESTIEPLNPTAWVDQIKVPVFLAGAWQDEQTGPFFTTLLDRFTSAPLTRFTVYNGVHPDGFSPQVLIEWKNFLDLYVAEKIPVTNKLLRTLAPVLFGQVFNSSLALPPDRFANQPSYEAALAAFQAEPSLRAIFESGAGQADDPGAPIGTFEKHYAHWPSEAVKTLRYYLHADGTLSAQMPASASAASSFDLDPAAGERGILAPNGDVWDKLPAYDWMQPQSGKAVIFETPAMTSDQLFLGTGSADLYVQSNVDDADLQVTISEVRPDGKEMYVQSGWLRASYRALAQSATELWPEHTWLYADTAPLPSGQWTLVRVPIAGFGHAFRAGSKLRLTIDTPGGTRAEWRFQLKTFPNGATHSIGHSSIAPSSVALPLLAGETVPTPLPPCPSLRGQPCRDYAPFVNRPVH